MSSIIQTIDREVEHSQHIEDAFVRAICLLETHYHKRRSSLLKIFPELEGENVTGTEAAEIRRTLTKFIESSPGHSAVPAAIRILALPRDKTLHDFFVTQLRLYLGWSNPGVVFALLFGLEDLGEKVFYTENGNFIGSRGTLDADANFGVAKRYLERLDHPI